MSEYERLNAAADKIQAHLDAAASRPWRAADQTHGDWVGIQNGYIALASVVAPHDADLTVLAVNAMQAVARVLRVEAKTIERSPDYRADATIAALADQILGGQR